MFWIRWDGHVFEKALAFFEIFFRYIWPILLYSAIGIDNKVPEKSKIFIS